MDPLGTSQISCCPVGDNSPSIVLYLATVKQIRAKEKQGQTIKNIQLQLDEQVISKPKVKQLFDI